MKFNGVGSSILPMTDNVYTLGLGTNRWLRIWGEQLSATASIGLRSTNSDNIATMSVATTNGYTGPFLRDQTGINVAANSGMGFYGRNNNNNDTVAATSFVFTTGSKTTGNADGGHFAIFTGTGFGTGVRGKIRFSDGTNGIIGHVWTSTDSLGNGNWAAPAAATLPVSISTFTGGSAPTGVWTDLTSLNLTTGTWLITGMVQVGNNTGSNDYIAITKFVGNDGTSIVFGQNAGYVARVGAAAGGLLSIPSLRVVVVAANENWYLKGSTDNAGSATNIAGRLSAVKVG